MRKELKQQNKNIKSQARNISSRNINKNKTVDDLGNQFTSTGNYKIGNEIRFDYYNYKDNKLKHSQKSEPTDKRKRFR